MARNNQSPILKSKFVLTLILLMFLAIFLTPVAIALQPEDLILQKRTNSPVWSQYETYTENESVIYNGNSYKAKNTNIGIENRPDINPAGWENIPVNANANALEILTNGNFTYNGYVGIKGNLNGQETKIFKRNLIALDNYQKQEFEVIIYTGNDGLKYSIYHHENMTDNKTFVRENGQHLFDVYSKDGFIKYNTSEFSTQIAVMPDRYLATSDYLILPTDAYFTDYDVDYTIVSLEDLPSAWGYSGNQVELVKTSKLEETSPDMDILHGTANLGQASNSGIDLGDEIIEYTSYTDSLDFKTYVIVQDGFGNYEGDNYMVYVTGSVSQIASISNANIDGTGQAERNWGDFFNDYETIEITYNDGGLVNITQSIGSASPDSNYGTNFDTVLDYYNGDVILYMYGNDVASGPTTINVKAIGYDDSVVTDTFTLTTTAVEPPFTGGGDLLNGTVLYYSFDNVNLSGSNPLDLTSHNNDGTNNGATTGATGILNQAFDLEASESDYISIPDSNDFSFTDGAGNDLAATISYWIKHETLSDFQTPIAKYTNTNREWYFLSYGDGRISLSFSDPEGNNYIGRTCPTGSLTTGSFQHVVGVYDGSETSAGVEIYIDNVQCDTSDLQAGTYTGMTNSVNAVQIGRRESSFYLDGVIDELLIVNNYSANTTEINFLYNSGNPTSDQQYPYTFAEATTPYYNTTTGFPNPFYVTSPSSVELINLGTRWYDYDDLYLYFTDPTNSSLINITTGDVYNGTYFDVIFNSTTETAQFYPLGNHNITLYSQACNTNGCNESSGFEMRISGYNPPTFVGTTLNLVDLYENESSYYNLNSYFDDYNQTYVTYTDPINSSLINITNGESSNNTFFEVSLVGSDLFTINTHTGYNNTTSVNFSVQVCNNYGCISESDFIKYRINPNPTTPPTQIAGFIDFDVYVNQTYNISLGNYFVNATSYNVYFVNPATATNQTLSLGQTVDAISFNISYTIGNIIQIYGYSSVSNNPVYVQACNVNGCLNYTSFGFSIIEPVIPPEPVDLDDTFNTIFGESSVKTKMLGALVLIGAMFMAFFGATNTVVGGLVGAFLGLIASVVFGLISVLTLVLIIIVPIMLFVFIMLFRRD